MSSPRVEIYFLDGEGVRWRVHDVDYRTPGKPRVNLPPEARSTYRAFVPRSGAARVYRFLPGEPRGLTTEHLARQLAGSEYLGADPFDPTSRTPL